MRSQTPSRRPSNSEPDALKLRDGGQQTPSRRPTNSEPEALKFRAGSREPRAPSPKPGSRGSPFRRGQSGVVNCRVVRLGWSNSSGRKSARIRVVKRGWSNRVVEPKWSKPSGQTRMVQAEGSNPSGLVRLSKPEWSNPSHVVKPRRSKSEFIPERSNRSG